MPKRPKTRWSAYPKTTTESFEALAEAPGMRMDATFFIAQRCLSDILGELRHDTTPSLEDFMESIDFILDHPKVMRELVKLKTER